MSSSRKQNTTPIKLEVLSKPESLSLGPIREKTAGVHGDRSECEFAWLCFLDEDAVVYVTCLHVFYLVSLMVFVLILSNTTPDSVPVGLFLPSASYVSVALVFLTSIVVFFLANRAHVLALLLPLIVWQFIVTLFLMCCGGYLLYIVTVMTLLSTRWRVAVGGLVFFTVLLFVGFHLFAVILTFKYAVYIKQRSLASKEVDRWKLPLETYKNFDQNSFSRKKQPSSVGSVRSVSGFSSSKKMATITFSEPINV